jgi:hypothetical protein
MFEDFKETIRNQKISTEKPQSSSYSPEVLEKLQERGMDPDNVTLKQLFPATLDSEVNDTSKPINCVAGLSRKWCRQTISKLHR